MPLRGAKQRSIAAFLLLHANAFVPRDRLIDAAWPDRPPTDATHALDLQLSRLRKLLGPDRIATRSGGYSLRIDPDELDLTRFERLRARAAEEPPAQAAAILRDALALWRGPPLADVADEPFARAEVARLEELRLTTLDERIAADLALGHHRELLPELEGLVARHPYREHHRGALMRALYASGRQVEALAVYESGRVLLRDELGLEPGERLRALHRAILRQDPELSAVTAPSDAAGGPRLPEPAAEGSSIAPGRVTGPTGARRRRRRAALAVVAGLALAGILAAVLVDGRDAASEHRAPAGATATASAAPAEPSAVDPRDGEPHEVALSDHPSAVAYVELATGRVLSEVPVTGGGGAAFVSTEDADWLLTGAGLLIEIDPTTRRVRRTESLGVEPGGLAVGGGWVWVPDANASAVLRIDPSYPRARTTIELPTDGLAEPASATGVAVDRGAVWVVHGLGRVTRLDATTGRVGGSVDVPQARTIAARDGMVWVAASDLGELVEIDPATTTVITRLPLAPSFTCCVEIGGGYVWALSLRALWKVAPEGRVIASIPIDGDGANLTYDGEALWVAEGISGKASRVDPYGATTASLHADRLLVWATAREGVAAVVVDPLDADPTAGIDGPVLHIDMAADELQPSDLAIDHPSGPQTARDQLAALTCASLADGPPPTYSPDRRTATFRVTPGLRFSPPSGAAVTAETFRYTIERALSPGLGTTAGGSRLLSDVVGLDAFRAGRAEHVSGIRARGDALSLTLRAPAGDLRARLAAPAFCAVPIGTAIVRNGLADEPAPSAGRWYVEKHAGGVYALLRPNPNHPEPTTRLAAILYTMAIPPAISAGRVERGEADYVAGADPALAPASALAHRLGRAEAGDEPRYVRTPLLATTFLVLQTHRGAFRRAPLRRAAILALDRPGLAAAGEQLATDRLLPPTLPGGTPSPSRNPVVARDLARARALARPYGPRTVTLAVCRSASCGALGRLVRANLASIGLAVRVRALDDPTAAAVHEADIVLDGTVARYADALAFLRDVLAGPAGRAAPDAARAADAAQALHGAARDAAARDLETTLLAAAIVAPVGTPAVPELFSERVGCRRPSPASYGVDLGSLCLRERRG